MFEISITDNLKWAFVYVALFLTIASIVWKSYVKTSKVRRLLDKLPGPKSYPILGNALDFNVDRSELFQMMVCSAFCLSKIGIFRFWLGFNPYVIIFHPRYAKVILSSSTQIDKSSDYDFVQPWLGTGLLTSKGAKWQSRRKLLTPAFHFRILEDFLQVFNEQSEILVKQLSKEIGNESFDISPYVTLCTLDIICDSVMGRHVNAQGDSDSSYVKATERIKTIIHSRQMKIWMWPNWLFNLLPIGREHARCLRLLHQFTDKVIREKIEEWKNKKIDDQDSSLGRKRRLAFLDLLIQASEGGKVLSNHDIREEVDTFMFEGHDTTAVGICWALYLLGSHPEIQKKVHDELDSIFGSDNRPVTTDDLKEMKYLECVIKETLRLFPSVPLVGRLLTEDVVVGNYTIPASTSVVIGTYMLHRNPTVFPEPEMFDPDRFLPENAIGRHPYAYVPFSAGPRNCIGQKFALMELKVVLSRILRSYYVEAVKPLEDMQILIEIVTSSENGFRMRLTRRLVTDT